MITFIYLVCVFTATVTFGFWAFILALVADFVLLMFLSGFNN